MAKALYTWTAYDMRPDASAPPAFNYTAGTNIDYVTWDFNKDADQIVYVYGVIPQFYTAAANIEVDFYWVSAGAGNVVWAFAYGGRTDNEALDAALSSASGILDATNGAGDVNIATATFATPALAPGDFVMLKLYRDADDGTDTLNNDAQLHAVTLLEA